VTESVKNIVILGAGFGGLRAALDLSRELRFKKEYRVVVLDRRAHHLYTPLLYEVATGYFEKETVECEGMLKAGACMLLERLPTIISRHHIQFKSCDAASIDATGKTILCSDGERLPYEHLIIALGTQVDYPPIDGLKEHALAIKTVDDALNIRRLIRDYIDRRRAGTEEKVSVVICGAGATGVELSAELTRFMKQQMMQGHLALGDFSITLVEAGSRVLGVFDQQISKWALERLHRLGVKVMLDTCVKRIERGRAVLAPRPLKAGESADALLCEFAKEKEKVIEGDVIVWAGGVRVPKILEDAGFAVDRKGRVIVDATLGVATPGVEGPARVYAIGDCAALNDPATKLPYPQVARMAISMGSLAAANVSRAILGEPPAHFRKPFWGAVIPMGGKWGIAELGSFRFRGPLAYALHKLIDLKYFLSILGLQEALTFWWRGARIYIKND